MLCRCFTALSVEVNLALTDALRSLTTLSVTSTRQLGNCISRFIAADLITDVNKGKGINVAKVAVKPLGIFVVQEISLHIGIVVALCIVVKVDRDRAFKNIVITPFV
jgi:hypothetical protein